MKIRTYYWNDRILNPIRRVKLKLSRKPKSPYLRIGNAGDLFTRDIIQWKYGKEPENIKKRGQRIYRKVLSKIHLRIHQQIP